MIKILDKIDVRIYLLGEGNLGPKLKVISTKYKKDIKFLKFINKPFNKYHKKIDLLCITSKFDGTPNVLGEGISYSIPCIAPKNVGLANILLKNGKGGHLYTQGNDKSFQNTVVFALKNYKKTINKTKIASKTIDNFSKKKTLGKLIFLISRL